MKLHSLNLASASNTANPTAGVKKIPPKRAWSESRDRFWDEATLFRSLNFANASTMASTTPGVKNSHETGVMSVT